MTDPYDDADIADLLDTPAPICWRPAPDVGSPTWDVLDDATANERFADLDAWVTWLGDRYGLDRTQIPHCWAEHPPIVEELTALWGAWQIAYYPSASAASPLEWHTAFDHTRRRLRDWTSRTDCTHGRHERQA